MVKNITAALLLFLCLNGAEAQIKLVQVASNLDRPVDIEQPPDGTTRLFFVLQGGKIVIHNGTTVLATPYLNISSSVSCCGEEGLLSLAFHPNYSTNGFFYIYYVNTSGNLVLARYKVSSNTNIANANSKTILLTIQHPTNGNHNGGELQFGKDSYLYLSVGDGGGGGDQANNAQNLGKLLGKILRIDVNSGTPYGIPPTNPFVNTTGAKKEIWAYGYRNLWRFSFDRVNGNMYSADVGQNTWEEINREPANTAGGINYGWRRMEGKHCYNPATNCNTGSLKLPIIEYSHPQGCSITGGYVYRGTAISNLIGTYFYSDYCSGIIRGAKLSSGQWTTSQLLASGKTVSTFGEDRAGELYIAHHASPGGVVYKIVKQ